MASRSALTLILALLLLGAAGAFFLRQGQSGTQGNPGKPPGAGPAPLGPAGSILNLAPPELDSNLNPAAPLLRLDSAETDASERSAIGPGPDREEDASFVVRVLTEGGAPVKGVAIQLRGMHGGTPFGEKKSDDRGEAKFASAAIGMLERALGQGKPVVARLCALGSFEPTETIDASVFERGELEFVVPAYGSVRVSVSDVGGTPFVGPATVSLGFVRDDEAVNTGMSYGSRASVWKSTLNDARQAFFPVVEPGGLLELQVKRPRSWVPTRMLVDGPDVAGEVVEVPLTWGSDHSVLRLRVLDATGSPLTETRLKARLGTRFMGQWDDRTEFLTTSSEGYLDVDLSNNWAEGNQRRLKLTIHGDDWEQASSPIQQAVLDLSLEFGPGRVDLGDIQLINPGVFVAGRVFDVDGTPRAKTKIVLEVFEDNRWNVVNESSITSRSDGRFQSFHLETGERFRVSAEVTGMVGTVQEFVPGQDDLSLEVREGGSLAGRVLLGNGIEASQLRLELEPTEPQEGSSMHLTSGSSVCLRDDGSFLVEGLAPASYTLTLRSNPGWHQVWSAADLEVQVGQELQDPRLNPVDLREALFKHRVTLKLPEGNSRREVQLLFGPAGAESLDDSLWVNLLSSIDVLGARRIDLAVSVSGFRSEQALDIAGDVELTLRPAPLVRLHVDGNYALPEPPYFVRPFLASVGGAGRPLYDWNSPALDTRHEVVIPAQEPGLCEVHWLVQRRGYGVGVGSVVEWLGHQVNVIDSDVEQSASIVLTQEQLDEIMSDLGD